MSAIRLARGFTGRDVIVKFAGCYHGHVDALLASAGSGVATFALPDSAGVPRVERRRDDRAALQRPCRLEAAFAERGDEIAAVITEAARRQHGRRPAGARLHRGAASRHGAHGALLVSDEVMTGFRCQRRRLLRPRGAVCRGRARPVHLRQGHGRGLPDRRVRRAAPTSWRCSRRRGPVYQAGTLSGNPVASAAGLATLQGCTPAVYERLDVVAHAIADAVAGRAERRVGAAHDPVGRARCSRSSSATAPSRLRRRQGPGHRRLPPLLPLDARARACTCRRARSSRGSSRPRTTTRRSTTCSRRCRPRPAPPPPPD